METETKSALGIYEYSSYEDSSNTKSENNFNNPANYESSNIKVIHIILENGIATSNEVTPGEESNPSVATIFRHKTKFFFYACDNGFLSSYNPPYSPASYSYRYPFMIDERTDKPIGRPGFGNHSGEKFTILYSSPI